MDAKERHGFLLRHLQYFFFPKNIIFVAYTYLYLCSFDNVSHNVEGRFKMCGQMYQLVAGGSISVTDMFFIHVHKT